MLKSDYTSVFMASESFQRTIDEAFDTNMDYAMEAADTDGLVNPPQAKVASPTSGQDTKNKPAEVDSRSALKDTVKTDEKTQVDRNKLINDTTNTVIETVKRIGNMIKNLQNKLVNRNKAIEKATESFKQEFTKQRQQIKPDQEIKLINFSYDVNYLDRTMKAVLKDVRNSINALSFEGNADNDDEASSEVLKSAKKDMLTQLFSKYAKGEYFKDPPTSTQEFVRGMILQYRGEKKEFTYKDTQVNQLERLGTNTREIFAATNSMINEMNGMYGRLKMLPNKVQHNTDDKVLRKIKTSAYKAAILMDAYATLVQSYYEAKLEYTLSYRVILKHMYHM